MAIATPILANLSGSIGAVTWSHNRGGPYARRRSVPVNPNTAKQQSVRQALGIVSGIWRSLTPPQQVAWGDWAALNPVVNSLGQTIQLSGQSAFCSLNARIWQSTGGLTIPDPPITPAPPTLVSFTATWTAATSIIVVTFGPSPLAGTEQLAFWTTLPGSTGRNPNFAQARLIGYGPLADVTPTSFTSPYPGVANAAANVWCAVMDQASGLMSVALKRRIILV
jgi:hypothetical protein